MEEMFIRRPNPDPGLAGGGMTVLFGRSLATLGIGTINYRDRDV